MLNLNRLWLCLGHAVLLHFSHDAALAGTKILGYFSGGLEAGDRIRQDFLFQMLEFILQANRIRQIRQGLNSSQGSFFPGSDRIGEKIIQQLAIA